MTKQLQPGTAAFYFDAPGQMPMVLAALLIDAFLAEEDQTVAGPSEITGPLVALGFLLVANPTAKGDEIARLKITSSGEYMIERIAEHLGYDVDDPKSKLRLLQGGKS